RRARREDPVPPGEVEVDVVALDGDGRGALRGLLASEVLSGHGSGSFGAWARTRAGRGSFDPATRLGADTRPFPAAGRAHGRVWGLRRAGADPVRPRRVRSCSAARAVHTSLPRGRSRPRAGLTWHAGGHALALAPDLRRHGLPRRRGGRRG